MDVNGHCVMSNAELAAGESAQGDPLAGASSPGTGGNGGNPSVGSGGTSAASSGTSGSSAASGDAGQASARAGSGGSQASSSQAGANVAGAGGMSISPSADAGGGSGGSPGAAGPVCTDGRTPSEETCDNQDNDCDGRIDEEIAPRPCGPMKVGVCHPGTESCDAGTWSACEGAVEPVVEVCEGAGLDEDCNGVANDGCTCTTGETNPCGTDTGACKPGTNVCENGAWGKECVGSVQPTAEVCNSVDDDCDGTVDNQPKDCTGSTTRCSQGRCVQCTDSSQCPAARECMVASCNASGSCGTSPKAAKAACATGICDGKGNCVQCLDVSDCKNADPVCESNRCMTKPHCGNGKLDSGENCEISDPLWANDTMSTCDRNSCFLTDAIYHQCSAIGESCWSGSAWFCGPTKVCSVVCINDDQCKTTRHSNAQCLPINADPADPTRSCAIPCSTSSGCPSGLSCVQAGNPIKNICGMSNWVAQ
jgi:Putative metal-binding motif